MFTRRQESNGGGGNFLKLENGQSVTVVFRGDVYEFFQAWPKGGQKKVSDAPFEGAKLRFKVNVIVYEDGKFVAKIWEFPITVNNQLADLAEEFDLSKTKVKITRHGSDQKTTYTVMPVMREPLTAKVLKAIDAVELCNLNPVHTPPGEFEDEITPADEAEEGDNDEVPF